MFCFSKFNQKYIFDYNFSFFLSWGMLGGDGATSHVHTTYTRQRTQKKIKTENKSKTTTKLVNPHNTNKVQKDTSRIQIPVWPYKQSQK